MSDELKHYGTPRRSGRYPWGSGEDPHQRAVNWQAHIKSLKDKGLSDTDIAKFEGITTTQLRARISLAKDAKRNSDQNVAVALKDKGYSNVEIGRKMVEKNIS